MPRPLGDSNHAYFLQLAVVAIFPQGNVLSFSSFALGSCIARSSASLTGVGIVMLSNLI